MICEPNDAKIEDALFKACLAVNERDWDIVYGFYGHRDLKCCCPMTALAMTEQENVWDEDGFVELLELDAALTKFGFPTGVLDAIGVDIFEGFDGFAFTNETKMKWYLVGQNVRDRLEAEGIFPQRG